MPPRGRGAFWTESMPYARPEDAVIVTLPGPLGAKVLKVAERVHRNYQRGYDQWGREAKHKFDALHDDTAKKLQRRQNSFGAEAAVACLYAWTAGQTEIMWGEGNRKKPDVGDWIEVKWSNWGGLPVANHDLEVARPYILVSGFFPTFSVLGWAWGTDINGKRELHVAKGEFLPGSDYPASEPSFILPRDMLNPWPAPPQLKADYPREPNQLIDIRDDYPASAWDITGEEPTWL